jgi:hypothetical protein
MTFTYAGQTFRIVFFHDHRPDESFFHTHCEPIIAPLEFPHHVVGSRVRAVTHCYIERWVDKKWRVKDRLMGIACCSLKDSFNKETGRKIALARCLKPCDRVFRKQAWEAYLGRLIK